MRRHIATCAIVLAMGFWCAAGAATVDVTGFGQQGWAPDDMRDATGADLVGTYTNAPKAGDPGGDEVAIESQLQFVNGPAGSTYGGAISIDGTTGNSGKTNFSTINTLSGFGASSGLVGGASTFNATYQWYGLPNATSRTLAFKLGIQSTAFGTGVGQSQNGFTAGRSGESAWDLVLVHIPAASDNTWSTVSVDHDSGGWNLFRQAGNGFFTAVPQNLPDPNAPTKTLDDWAADPDYGSLLFGAGARVTSVQFGLGSSQRNSISYVDYLQTSLLNGGDVLNFNTPEPGSLALMGVFGVAAMAKRRRRVLAA